MWKEIGMVNASQTFKMYEVVNKYLKNTEDAKAIVLGIEGIIEEKFVTAKDLFATKDDIKQLELATKQDLRQLETRMEQNFKDQLKWIIMLMFGFSSLIITVLKLI